MDGLPVPKGAVSNKTFDVALLKNGDGLSMLVGRYTKSPNFEGFRRKLPHGMLNDMKQESTPSRAD